MSAFLNVQNTWAPEGFWDEQTKDWLITGKRLNTTTTTPAEGLRICGPPTDPTGTPSRSPKNSSTAASPPSTPPMLHRDLNGHHNTVMVLKDQTTDPLRYNERWASALTVNGPSARFQPPSTSHGPKAPASFRSATSRNHCSIPTAHPNPHYEGVETTDWIHWTSINDKMHTPPKPQSTAASSASPKKKPNASSPAMIRPRQ